MKYKYFNLLTVLLVLFVPFVVFAQFGKNKVQYQTFNWKYISSTNFDVYYNEGSHYLAEFTAREAEISLAKITSVLRFKLFKRVPIVVYNSQNEFQQTNIIGQYMSEGIMGVTEMLKNRVVLPFMGDYSQFRHVVHHELVHAVLNQYLYGGTFQTAIQTGQNVQFPLYMNEGLAEFLSIGGIDTENDMFMRDLAIGGNLRGLDYLNGYLAYRGGQTFYWYIAEKYGENKIPELISKLKIGYSLNTAFNEVFKIEYKDFSEQWLKDLKKYYWPDIERFEDVSDFAQKITDHKKENTFYNSSPAISPNGEKIAYITDVDGLYAIYVRSTNGKDKPKKIVSSFRAADFEELNLLTPGISWNPDGKKLAISAKAGPEDAIFIYDFDEDDYEKLSLGFSAISSVNWSPDGKFLTFIGSKVDKSNIYIYEFKTKKTTQVTNDYYTELSPVWGSSNNELYFISNRVNDLNSNSNIKIWDVDFDLSDIYSIDIQSGNIKRLTFDGNNVKTSIAYAAGENQILYISDKNGIGNIYSLNLNDLTTKPRTNSLTGLTQLSINSDGSKLAFASMNNGGIDAFLLRFPFEKTVPGDTLPLTKFKESLKNNKGSFTLTDIDSAALNYTPDEVSYGSFKMDLSKQRFVKNSPDASQPPDEAGSISLSDESFVEKDYKLQFTLDAIMGNPGYSTFYGFAGNAFALFSDIMGDNQIYVEASLFRDLKNSNLMVTYAYLPEILDYQVSVFHNAAYFRRSDYYYYRFRNWGLSLSSAYPFDRFNRIEFGMNWFNTSRENMEVTSDPTINKMMLVPEVRYVHDDVLWGWYAPFEGSRYFIEAKGSPKIQSDGLSFMVVNGDFRYYYTIFNYITFAMRGKAGASFGANPRQFYIGGTDNWINRDYSQPLPLDDPEDFVFMQFETPLRGWELSSLSGSRYFLTNFEMRFPLFQALVAGPIPILLQGVMGSFFFDMGGAWDGNFKDFSSVQTLSDGSVVPKDLKFSTGIGVRTYLFGLPIKFDIAWKNMVNTWSKPQYWFSLGYDF